MLNAGLEAAGLCFRPPYTMSAGWTEERATLPLFAPFLAATRRQI